MSSKLSKQHSYILKMSKYRRVVQEDMVESADKLEAVDIWEDVMYRGKKLVKKGAKGAKPGGAKPPAAGNAKRGKTR